MFDKLKRFLNTKHIKIRNRYKELKHIDKNLINLHQEIISKMKDGSYTKESIEIMIRKQNHRLEDISNKLLQLSKEYEFIRTIYSHETLKIGLEVEEVSKKFDEDFEKEYEEMIFEQN